MTNVAELAADAKNKFIAVINRINAAGHMPASFDTMNAMQRLSGVWTSSFCSLEQMTSAQADMTALGPFFAGHADANLRELWDAYAVATRCYTDQLTLQQSGC